MGMMKHVSSIDDCGRGDVPSTRTTRKDGSLRIQQVFRGQGRTKQEFVKECDINFIMQKYTRTGVLPELIKTDPKYGDFSSAPDFREAQDIIAHANEQFAALSSRQRERFGNDPARFLEFVADGENSDEMAKLGFMKPEAVERVKQARSTSGNAVPVEERRIKEEAPKAKAGGDRQPKAKPQGDRDE